MDVAQREYLLAWTSVVIAATFTFLALYFHNPRPELFLDFDETVDDKVRVVVIHVNKQ